MPSKEDQARPEDILKTADDKTVMTDEMIEAAKASAKEATKARDKEEVKSGVGVMRRKGDSQSQDPVISDVPYPAEVHGEDFEHYGPQGFGAVIPEGTEIEAYSIDQEFLIDPEKVKGLPFTPPGRNLPKKRLYNIKGIHKDGRIVQLPFETQIQNNAGGDPEDAIGLRRYQRKGIKLLLDWNTLVPIYCAAWDCWAKADNSSDFVGFCSQRHAMHTLPNKYKDAAAITGGMFGQNATTSRTWSA